MLTDPTLFIHSMCCVRVCLTLTSLASSHLLRFTFSLIKLRKQNKYTLFNFFFYNTQLTLGRTWIPFFYSLLFLHNFRHLLFYSVAFLSNSYSTFVLFRLSWQFFVPGRESESWGGWSLTILMWPVLLLTLSHSGNTHWHMISWTQICHHSDVISTKSCNKSITFYVSWSVRICLSLFSVLTRPHNTLLDDPDKPSASMCSSSDCRQDSLHHLGDIGVLHHRKTWHVTTLTINVLICYTDGYRLSVGLCVVCLAVFLWFCGMTFQALLREFR